MRKFLLLARIALAGMMLTEAAVADDPPPANSQIMSNPGATRFAAGLAPYVSLVDPVIGGHADALDGAAQYGASGANVGITAIQFLNVSVTSAGGNAATISPAWVLPNIAALPSAAVEVAATGVISGSQYFTAINNTTGAVTISGTFTAGTNMPAVLAISNRGYNQTNSLNGAFYGPVTVSTATDATTGVAYGSNVVLSQPMFPKLAMLTAVPIHVRLDAPGQPSWFGRIINDSTVDYETITVTGEGTSPPTIPAALAAAGPKVSWGPFLFRPDDATACSGSGRSIEVPQAGTGTTSGGQINPFEGTISSVYDAFSAILTASVGTTVANGLNGVEGRLRTGCDDWPALQSAVNAAYRNPNTAENPQMIYIPRDSFMASASQALTQNINPMTLTILCGEGTVYWPSYNTPFYHGAASCNRNHAIKSFPDANDLVPALALKRLSALTAGSTATVVVIGNSPAGPGTNGANFISGRQDRIKAWLQGAYPDLTIQVIDRTCGGSQMYSVDPSGLTGGIPVCSGPPPWYTNPALGWLTGYVEPLNPDLIILGFADQETTSLSIASLLGFLQATQSAAWASTTGKNPDIGIIPWPWQPTAFWSQVKTRHAQSFLRSFTKACVTKLANGGCPFLIDEARQLSIVVDGDDPETTPMRAATAAPVANSQITTFPWSYQVPRTGLSDQVGLKWTNATATVGGALAAAGGEFDFTVSGNANATPQSIPISETESAAAAAGQAVITIGSHAYRYSAGWSVTGQAGLPANALVLSVNGAAGTVTLNNNLTGSGIANNAALTFSPPAAASAPGYPGGILRIGKDGGSGNLNYRYDTVFFQASAGVTGVSGNSYITYTGSAPPIGAWDGGLQIAIPGAGTSQCPNPGGASNCYIATIGSISYTVTSAGITGEQINLTAGATAATALSTTAASIPTTVSTPVQPYVFRTSIPLKVSLGAVAETFPGGTNYNFCVNNGTSVSMMFMIEYRGSRLNASYCYDQYPGEYWFLSSNVERFDSPFLFTVDSPNHMASSSNFTLWGPGFAFALAAPSSTAPTANGQALNLMEVALEHPTAMPTARLAPDIYGWYAGSPTGDTYFSIWGGAPAAHYSQMGANLIDDPILSVLRPR